MWSDAPTVEECLGCNKPFSFFFDLIAKYWKASRSNNLPLHRICTLARKQDATFVVFSCALKRSDVREEIDTLNSQLGGDGVAEAVAISFFTGSESPQSITAVADSAFVGETILINYRPKDAGEFTHSYIYEAVIAIPFQLDGSGKRIGLLNNFIGKDHKFCRSVRGREFEIQGIYYCQQNALTHVCAHSGLRMALNTSGHSTSLLTAQSINQQLKINPPFAGLQLGQIVEVVRTSIGVEPMIVDCSKVGKQDYLSILASYVESGCLALLVFTTGNGTEHVVTVFGHTKNSDEWHPQGIPGYSGASTAKYYPSSAWIDHFLIHDDNLGPYYTLSARALEVDQSIVAHWIIAIQLHPATMAPHVAESLGAMVLENTLPTLSSLGAGKWFKYITEHQRRYVMRAILLERKAYRDHLLSLVDHDGNKLTAEEVKAIEGLPEWFWMVEFSLPSLTTGNRSKLGEVLIDTNRSFVHGVRIPSMLIALDSSGQETQVANGISSHAPYYVSRDRPNSW